MESLELTIINAIMKHPLLYKDTNFEYSKQKVLNQLFFVNGNGYEWVDGQLTDGEELVYNSIPKDSFNTTMVEEPKDDDFMRGIYKELNINSNKIKLESYGALTIYPICEYAKILHLPDDIEPDWLFGAIEALLLAENYFDNPYQHCLDTYISDWMEDRNYKAIQKYLKEQKKFLRVAEKRIKYLTLEMFKKGLVPGT